jgi:hypothetical protein
MEGGDFRMFLGKKRHHSSLRAGAEYDLSLLNYVLAHKGIGVLGNSGNRGPTLKGWGLSGAQRARRIKGLRDLGILDCRFQIVGILDHFSSL